MDQAPGMGVQQRLGHGIEDLDRPFERWQPPLQFRLQCLPRDVGRDHIDRSLRRCILGHRILGRRWPGNPSDVVDGDQVRVVRQTGHISGFGQVLIGIGRGLEMLRFGHLDRHLPAQFQIVAQPHSPVGPLAQETIEAVTLAEQDDGCLGMDNFRGGRDVGRGNVRGLPRGRRSVGMESLALSQQLRKLLRHPGDVGWLIGNRDGR